MISGTNPKRSGTLWVSFLQSPGKSYLPHRHRSLLQYTQNFEEEGTTLARRGNFFGKPTPEHSPKLLWHVAVVLEHEPVIHDTTFFTDVRAFEEEVSE